MRVLAVGAHPDDLDLLCGGTLARFVREGHEVTMCHATLGDKGSYSESSESISRIRRAEAQRSAEICGATYETLGLEDAEVCSADTRQRRLAVDLIRTVRPDLIITHAPGDYMSDHTETSKLVVDSSFHATLPLYGTGTPHHNKVTPVYYMDTVAGLGFNPSEFVDVSDVIDVKAAMLAAHQSQLTWLHDHDGVDIVGQMRTSAAYRGYQCGVAFAEGFTPCLTWLRATTYRLLP